MYRRAVASTSRLVLVKPGIDVDQDMEKADAASAVEVGQELANEEQEMSAVAVPEMATKE